MHSNTIWCTPPTSPCRKVFKAYQKITYTTQPLEPTVPTASREFLLFLPWTKFEKHCFLSPVSPLRLLNIITGLCPVQPGRSKGKPYMMKSFSLTLLYSCHLFYSEHPILPWQPAAEISWRRGMDMLMWYLQDRKTTKKKGGENGERK